MKVKSPLTGSENVELKYEVAISEIYENYKKVLPQIDPNYIFGELKHLEVYKCKDIGYEFFLPLSVFGNDAYY